MASTGQRRALGIVLALSLVFAACAESVTVGTGVEGFEAAQGAQPTAEVVDDVALISGRDAIAAATTNGEPHILWFWGAN